MRLKMARHAVLRRIKKGLEPLIAAVILIAVTLVIAIAVVGWMSGLFSTTVGGAESLVILPNASLKKISANWNLNLSIRNTGSSASNVISIFVGDFSCNLPTGMVTIEPGTTKNITNADCGNVGIIPGTRYTVTVMTAAGNSFFSEVIARP
jgi:flagellin-like protein